VIVLNGSGGGINEPRGAMLASRGYQAFALGYFKAPGLSPFITETPLEYLETGLHWARDESAAERRIRRRQRPVARRRAGAAAGRYLP
jgi:hypothetical protein